MSVEENIYIGIQKVKNSNKTFMYQVSVRQILMPLKIKKSAEFDKIPQRVPFELVDVLATSFQTFSLIYAPKNRFQRSGGS
jgi:hypothetical protein